jgi:hypothetical protein
MSKPDIKINVLQKGLNRDTLARGEGEYSTLLNGVFDAVDEGTFTLTNEMSNILSSKFKIGFKVINATPDNFSDTTYFFLVNPQTGVGELGQIKTVQQYVNVDDPLNECSECADKYDFALPLEGQTQVALNAYETLLTDVCHADKKQGFNFNINYPIKKTVIKNEKNNKTIYFTDNYNKPRYIVLDDIERYLTTGSIICGVDETTPTCLDASKLPLIKKYTLPTITPISIELGGNVKSGVYEFLLAYCDKEENTISEFTSITNPVHIFDRNNVVQTKDEIGIPTNYSIKLEVENLDKNYQYYKVAVIQTTLESQYAPRVFIEGVHQINDNTVIYSGDQNKKEIDLATLYVENIHIERASLLTEASNSLIIGDLSLQKEINLQPVVNFLGSFLKWQTHIAPESLYRNGVNVSKFLSINRGEVVPYSIRFLLDGGYKTAIFPLIGRKATNAEKAFVVQNSSGNVVLVDGVPVGNNDDVSSILKNIGNCNTTDRVRRWQYYNDAEREGSCFNGAVSFIIADEVIKKTCYVDVPEATVPAGSITVTGDAYFNNLLEYIEDNFADGECLEGLVGTPICTKLTADYAATCGSDLYPTTPCAEDAVGCVECREVTVTNSVNLIDQINNETIVEQEKAFTTGYQKIPPPSQEYLYEKDSENVAVPDTIFQSAYSIATVYKRNSDFINEDCTYAKEATNTSDFSTNSSPQFFNNYAGDAVLLNLVDATKTTTPFTNFQTNIHKKALWFRVPSNGRLKYILELSKQKKPSATDVINTPSTQEVRISLFKSCASTSAIYSQKINLTTGGMIYFEKVGKDLKITDSTNTDYSIIDGWDTEYLVAIDNKIVLSGANYIITPTDGVYTVTTRDVEVVSRLVSWNSITIKKKIDYSATCSFKQPVVQECTAVPYEYGKFAYWESRETYPDNQETFNSTNLKIAPSDIPLEHRTEFATTFTDGRNIDYILKDEVNFSCQPIRHFRFPDNKVSPFMYENTLAPFSDAPIFPLGVTIDEDLINAFLDIAVKNNLISQEKRSLIRSYEILRGDISLDRTVVSSGLLFDMRKYEEDGKPWYYSNYPYNDLGKDKLNTDAVDNLGVSNSKFTYHSPETDYNSITVPSELSVQGYSFGASKGQFDQVEDHAKWVILSKKAKYLATSLAILEAAAEIVISTAQVASNAQIWAVGGVGSTGFSLGAPALAAAVTVAAFGIIEGIVSKVGRYRYEWMKTFENLGRPENFAYYYYSKGHYSYTKQLQTEGDQLRGINRGLRIKNGDFTINNEVTKDRVNVNNTDREWTTFLDLGTSAIEYPLEYRIFDNNNSVDSSTSSLTYLSENGDCVPGKSKEIQKNIASPYVALINYNPNQYGTINSIKWLPTGYRGDLLYPKSTCLSIFGGDTFIAPHSLKRKIPLFLTTMFGAADFTPFNYKFYNNIGKTPKFFVDYKVLTEFKTKKNSSLFPDIDYELKFDCENRSGNYYKSPSKFYLYYYGIPRFMTETRINTWNRTAEPNLDKDFYPNIGDINLWTQQKNVKIITPNYYFYNNIYSKQVTPLAYRQLTNTYSQLTSDQRSDKPNGIMWTLPDNSENNLSDPWLTIRPLDSTEFPTSYGKLKDIRTIENEQILARFEKTTALHNTVDMTIDDGKRPESRNLLTAFARRPLVYSETDLGYGGTQSSQSVSCEFGHFHVDAPRGQVIQIASGGKGMEEISSMIGGKPSGMRNWFKEQLPFKILKSNIKNKENIDTDNAINGVGITMGYDSRFRRVFITKKDYIPKVDCVEYIEGQGFFVNETLCNENPQINICEEGYTFDTLTQTCKKSYACDVCEEGFTYNTETNLCEKVGTDCEDGLDIVFVLDSTGSQNGAIDSIKASIIADIVPAIITTFGADYRLGLVSVTGVQTNGQPLFEILETMTVGNSVSFLAQINTIVAEGGGGAPEPTDKALEAVLNNTPEIDQLGIVVGVDTIGLFRTNAAKAIVLTTDNPPSGLNDIYEFLDWTNVDTIADTATTDGIQIFSYFTPNSTTVIAPIAPSFPTRPNVTYVMQNYATKTGGQYYFKPFGTGIGASVVDDITTNINCVETVPPNCPEEEQVEGMCVCLDEKDPVIVDDLTPINVSDPTYFDDLSWTIAYSPIEQKWIGWYSYKPNYYINYQNYFQTGVNDNGSKFGLWSHLLTNRSYQVFYGVKYPFIMEFSPKREYNNTVLKTVKWQMDVRRYHNEYDWSEIENKPLNKLNIWSKFSNSGNLHLKHNTGQIALVSQYPKTALDGSYQEVLVSRNHNDYSVNYFYNRLLKNNTNNPQWLWDKNQILKTVNTNVVKFGGKTVLETMKSNVFNIQLQQDETSLLRYTIDLVASNQNVE